jgi:hypothetical protein
MTYLLGPLLKHESKNKALTQLTTGERRSLNLVTGMLLFKFAYITLHVSLPRHACQHSKEFQIPRNSIERHYAKDYSFSGFRITGHNPDCGMCFLEVPDACKLENILCNKCLKKNGFSQQV